MKDLDERLTRRVAAEISSGGTRAGLLGELDERSRQKAIDCIVDLASTRDSDVEETVQIRRTPGFSKTRAFTALAAAAAIAALIVVVVGRLGKVEPEQKSSVSSGHVLDILGTIERVGGSVTLANREVNESTPLVSGALIRTSGGAASALLDVGARILFQEESLAHVDKTVGGVRVVLDSGAVWLVVDPKKRGREISVRTKAGDVVVKGTVFRVFTEADRAAVYVLRGEVELIPHSGTTTRLQAGRTGSLGSEKSAEMTASQMREDRDLLASLSLILTSEIPLPEDSEPALPETARVEAPVRNSSKSPNISNGMPLGSLLAEIRNRRASRDWVKVSELYETVIREYRETEAATAALVSLGQVRLEKLNDPYTAVRRFDEYLATGSNALKPEALQGKADALHVLGDSCAERRVLVEYIAEFPSALFAKQARQRLDRLNQSDLGGKACPDSRAAGTYLLGTPKSSTGTE
jgi:hypothetical protein